MDHGMWNVERKAKPWGETPFCLVCSPNVDSSWQVVKIKGRLWSRSRIGETYQGEKQNHIQSGVRGIFVWSEWVSACLGEKPSCNKGGGGIKGNKGQCFV